VTICDVAIAAIPHAVALLIALVAGWGIYQWSQIQRRDRMIGAALFETANNRSILRRAIEREDWRTDSIDVHRPISTVVPALLGDSPLYSRRIDRGLVIALFVYQTEIEAAGRTMDFMEQRFVSQGELTSANLTTLRRICRNAMWATDQLQKLLGEHARRRKIRVGSREEAAALIEEARRDREERYQ
jgi:hypothetical protein